jgi:hypothetical protein
MSTMTTMMSTTMTAEATLRTRESELQHAREVLAATTSERATKATAYASEMSRENLSALDALDVQVRHAKLNVETHERRVAESQRVHEEAERAEKRARVRELLAGPADSAALFPILRQDIAKIVDLDRQLSRILQTVRDRCALQRGACDEVRALAEALQAPELAAGLEPLHAIDARIAAGILVGRARAAEGRSRDRNELLLSPVELRPQEGRALEVTTTLATSDGYDFSLRIVEAGDGK